MWLILLKEYYFYKTLTFPPPSIITIPFTTLLPYEFNSQSLTSTESTKRTLTRLAQPIMFFFISVETVKTVENEWNNLGNSWWISKDFQIGPLEQFHWVYWGIPQRSTMHNIETRNGRKIKISILSLIRIVYLLSYSRPITVPSPKV